MIHIIQNQQPVINVNDLRGIERRNTNYHTFNKNQPTPKRQVNLLTQLRVLN